MYRAPLTVKAQMHSSCNSWSESSTPPKFSGVLFFSFLSNSWIRGFDSACFLCLFVWFILIDFFMALPIIFDISGPYLEGVKILWLGRKRSHLFKSDENSCRLKNRRSDHPLRKLRRCKWGIFWHYRDKVWFANPATVRGGGIGRTNNKISSFYLRDGGETIPFQIG